MTDLTTTVRASRREFMATTGAVVAAGALAFGDWTPASAQAAPLPRRRLGRTGLRVTALSFGAIQLADASHRRVLDYAVDEGINYIHTCPGYTGGRSIQIVGEVMRTKRDQVYLAVKASPGEVDDCLRILNTDHIDVLIPDTNDNSDEERERYAALREAGKIRFSGFAAHGDMEGRIARTAEAGWRDVVLVRYNLVVADQLNPVLDAAVESQKMGFMAMKVAEGPGEFTDKLTRLIRGNANMHTLTPGMNSQDQVRSNIAAIRAAFADGVPHQDLEEEAAEEIALACTDCSACTRACPQAVALDDYRRVDLYLRRGDQRLAEDLKRSIPARHSLAACTNCGACTAACARRIDVLSTARAV